MRSATRSSRGIRACLASLLSAVLVAACGGGSGSTPVAPPPVPVRGTLLQTPPERASTFSVASLVLKLAASATGSADLQTLAVVATQTLLLDSGTPVCDIAIYHLRYQTVGGMNEPATSSGALMVPSGSDPRCSGPRPIVLYAHGTSTDRGFNIADLSVQQNAEGLILAAFFAAQGMIVVAPNYAGYDTSTLGYHPYLNADQQSKEMIDVLKAARSALPTADAPSTTDGGRLYITGYSQGGYVAMATERAMEAAGMQVTAAAPMSGPYALAAFVDAVFAGEVDGGAPVVAAFLVTGYQKSYGNLYSSATDVFEPAYATGIEALLPSTVPRSTLYANGKLPQYALFSATPPSAGYAALTPPTSPAAFAPLYALGFGSGNLVTNAYRLSYLDDAAAHPDGGFPAVTSGVPADAPALALRRALKSNDLRSFTPTAPVLLCAGSGDPVVYFMNTALMQSYWSAHPPAAGLTVLDVDSAVTANDPYASLKQDFAAARTAVALDAVLHGATDGGAFAVASAYHATLVAPACFVAVRGFFASH
jgi:alpha-beta hydrolase superfamily lysophospholipase